MNGLNGNHTAYFLLHFTWKHIRKMANDTPESDFSIECFQNYSAPEVFVQGLAGMVNQDDIGAIIKAQKNMLQRFEKTTEMLTNCNQLSASRIETASVEFKKHTQVLLDMKSDLNYIFKKIRILKDKLSKQYPEAYEAAVAESLSKKQTINEDEEETINPGQSINQPGQSVNQPEKSVDLAKDIVIHAASEVQPTKKGNSSPDTESASSGDLISTDTG